MGKTALAEKLLIEQYWLFPEDPLSLLILTDYYVHMRNFTKAQQLLQAVPGIFGDNSEYLLQQARMYALKSLQDKDTAAITDSLQKCYNCLAKARQKYALPSRQKLQKYPEFIEILRHPQFQSLWDKLNRKKDN